MVIVAEWIKAIESEPMYKSEEEKSKCQLMVENLSDEEQEEAACSSYAYFMVSSGCSNNPPLSSEKRIKNAMKMARRHLVAEKGDVEKALTCMKETIQYRKKHNINDIRLAFHKSSSDTTMPTPPSPETNNNDNDNTTIRHHIESELSSQLQLIHGRDSHSRSIMIKSPRLTSRTNRTSFLLAHLYAIERAIACTEHHTCGTQDTFPVILDYADYERKNLPPMKMFLEMISELQRHYPERLAWLALVDAPLLLRGLWKVVKPFVDVDTRGKINFVTGEEQKKAVLNPLLATESRDMPFMLPGVELGTKIKRFLYDIPFHHPYPNNE